MKKGNYLKLFLFLLLVTSDFILYGQSQAQSKIDSLVYLLKNEKKDSVKIRNLNYLAREYSGINPDTAILLCNEALNLSKKINYKTGIGLSYHELGWTNAQLGEYSLALKNYENAIKIFGEINKELSDTSIGNEILKFEGNSLLNMGIVLSNQGNYYEALKKYNSALGIYGKIENKKGIGMAYGSIAGIYFVQGDFKTAIEYNFKALKISEDIGDKNSIATRLVNMGGVFQTQGEVKKAIEYFSKGLELFKEIGNINRISKTLGNIGTAYADLKEYDKAIIFYLEALQLAESTGDRNGLVRQFANLGSAYGDLKDQDKAIQYFEKGLLIAKEIGDKSSMAILLNNIGEYYLSIEKFKLAEKKLLYALSISEEINALDITKSTCESLSKLYTEMKDYENAFMYFKRATLAKDSIFNADITRNIAQIEMKYEFDKKEAIARTEQEKKDAIKNAEIEKQKQARNYTITGASVLILVGLAFFFVNKKKRETVFYLKVSETEMKALRAQMNPHFIVNALDSIKRFSGVNKAEEVDNYIEKFKNLMRFIVNNSQKEEISLEDDLDALKYYMDLEKARNPFTYEINIDETVDLEFDKIPPLILQPFVENAIKHGFQSKPTPGHINIYIRKENEILICIVEDNGVGRDLSEKVKNPMLIQNQSMGIRITKERLLIYSEKNKVKANFKIIDMFDNSTPTGTKVELSLPLVA